ncbi:MAG: beta-ketoacyl-[acyl-carrier-protein] synthase family protein [Isosphaeraceae bacterium]
MPELVDHKNRKRLVILGVGANCALGDTWPEAWKGLVAGQGGITQNFDRLPRDRFLSSHGGFVKGFGPGTPGSDDRLARLDARFLHLGLAAAEEAMQVLKGKAFDPERAAVVATSAFGGVDLQDNDRVKAESRGRLQIGPFTVPGLLINQLGGQISQHLGLFGPGFAPSNACASGGHAIITAALLLRADMADIALCGAAESAFVPSIYNAFYTMKAIAAIRPEDRASADPSQASRPFSIDRCGFVMSEGAGMLVMATLEQALKLQVPILAELVGMAVNSDGYHMAAPHQPRIEKCLAGAIADAGITPDSVGYYNAHGTSTPVNDATETAALKAVFGDHARRLPVSSIKGAIGHTLGAASAIEAITAIESLRNGVIVPTINHIPDPAIDLDYVPRVARASSPTYALSASFGFGGTNNALVFRRF